MRIVFVHGACVRDGAWWWHATGELLAQRGVQSAAAVLPSCGETGEPAGTDGPGLPEDVAALRQLLEDDGEPVVVVANSYGGIVAAEAAAASARCVTSCSSRATCPRSGRACLVRRRHACPVPGHRRRAGTFGVRPEVLVETFLHDCDPEIGTQR